MDLDFSIVHFARLAVGRDASEEDAVKAGRTAAPMKVLTNAAIWVAKTCTDSSCASLEFEIDE